MSVWQSHQGRIQFFIQNRLILDESHTLSKATCRDGLLVKTFLLRCHNFSDGLIEN